MESARLDFLHERDALRASLAEVGPDAPTGCGSWTTTDLAVHIVMGEIALAIPNAPFRFLVSRGIRLDRMAPFNERALGGYRRRHGFDWALARLGRNPPRLESHRAIAPVSLLEVWAHHEDVLAANDVGLCASDISLGPVLRVLTRYQRRFLTEHGVCVVSAESAWFAPAVTNVEITGADADLARWLSGRSDLDSLSITGDEQAVQIVRETTLSV
jgi:uncharacterized protein (TIGR03083 family)